MIRVVTPLPGLWVSQQHGTEYWCVREDYSVVLNDLFALKGYALTIPAGYRYNRASIPDWIEWLVSKDDLGCVAPLVHDALYNCEGYPALGPPVRYSSGQQQSGVLMAWCDPHRTFTRAETDELFYQIMLADKVSSWRARLAYWAVRLFGGKW